jgi:hypothetical protein
MRAFAGRRALREAASRPLQHDKVIEGQNSAGGSHNGGVTPRVVAPAEYCLAITPLAE